MLGRFQLNLIKKIDWKLLIAIVVLILFGLAAIYSLTMNQENPDLSNFNKQAIFFVIGLFFLFLFTIFDYRVFINYSFFIYVGGGVILLLVLFFGQTIRGSTSWFSLFGWTFQPVELAKITLILYLSKYFSDNYSQMYQFKKIIVSALITLPYVLLVILQPDFGSAIILVIIWLGLLLLNRTKRIHVVIFICLLIIIMIFSWFFVFEDYQKKRISTFINPSSDPLGAGYNPTQSIIAVGSGMFFGRGLGLGPQSQLNFLPVAEKDFIFAVIAEELGLFGAIILLFFLFYVFKRMIKALREQKNTFSLFLISGITISLFSQAFINIAGNIGLLPITGIPLPFLSYGGSSLVTSLIMIGLIQSIIVRSR
ncbi:MAG: rod shape-determining protein RodA [Patescibacteria group bacterium]|nr:rod shape-determining protein RodA [Patescibacteria group bacterium]